MSIDDQMIFNQIMQKKYEVTPPKDMNPYGSNAGSNYSQRKAYEGKAFLDMPKLEEASPKQKYRALDMSQVLDCSNPVYRN